MGDAIPFNHATTLINGERYQANLLIANAMDMRFVSSEDARSGLWQVVLALMLEFKGIVNYTANSERLLNMAKKVIGNG